MCVDVGARIAALQDLDQTLCKPPLFQEDACDASPVTGTDKTLESDRGIQNGGPQSHVLLLSGTLLLRLSCSAARSPER